MRGRVYLPGRSLSRLRLDDLERRPRAPRSSAPHATLALVAWLAFTGSLCWLNFGSGWPTRARALLRGDLIAVPFVSRAEAARAHAATLDPVWAPEGVEASPAPDPVHAPRVAGSPSSLGTAAASARVTDDDAAAARSGATSVDDALAASRSDTDDATTGSRDDALSGDNAPTGGSDDALSDDALSDDASKVSVTPPRALAPLPPLSARGLPLAPIVRLRDQRGTLEPSFVRHPEPPPHERSARAPERVDARPQRALRPPAVASAPAARVERVAPPSASAAATPPPKLAPPASSTVPRSAPAPVALRPPPAPRPERTAPRAAPAPAPARPAPPARAPSAAARPPPPAPSAAPPPPPAPPPPAPPPPAPPPRNARALPSCEAFAERYERTLDLTAPRKRRDESGERRARSMLASGTYFARCGVPASTALRICTAVEQGRAVAVTVRARPRAPKLEACVKNAVAGLRFPELPELEVFTTEFAPAR